MAADAIPRVTAEEYLAADRAASFRSEFVNGEVFAMSGGRLAHAQLSAQMSRELQEALDELPCIVTVADMRLQVVAGESYVYPDVMVACGGWFTREGDGGGPTGRRWGRRVSFGWRVWVFRLDWGGFIGKWPGFPGNCGWGCGSIFRAAPDGREGRPV